MKTKAMKHKNSPQGLTRWDMAEKVSELNNNRIYPKLNIQSESLKK